MPGTMVYEVNGFKFSLMLAMSRYDEVPSSNGVVVDPENADLNNPAYLEALKAALSVYPHISDYFSLTYSWTCERPDEAEDEHLMHYLEIAKRVVSQQVVQLDTSQIEYARDVFDRLQAEFDTREQKRIAKLEKERKHRTGAPGYVYLLSSALGHYKIGHTKNPKTRLGNFGVKLPFAVECLCLIETEDRYALEGELHKRFAEQRVNGEWFTLSADDVDYVKSLAVQS